MPFWRFSMKLVYNSVLSSFLIKPNLQTIDFQHVILEQSQKPISLFRPYSATWHIQTKKQIFI
ncbi:hypothetical protein BI380_09305 [Delftia tsuruhatensis]|uniref:Uncharacterized protein n=1 Tax=Delftia tsuruhatensis TaxID=180282 RepID=A0ABM6E2U7_9BURK|nr:hypothetical protein BI380_09305 [Delftia tsuruhatensis]